MNQDTETSDLTTYAEIELNPENAGNSDETGVLETGEGSSEEEELYSFAETTPMMPRRASQRTNKGIPPERLVYKV